MNDSPLTITKIVYIVFKRKWFIITLFLSVVATATVVSFLMKPTYEASAKLLVERDIEAEKALLFRMNLGYYHDQNERINTETEVMRSRPVAERVLKALHLENIPVNYFMSKLTVDRLPESNIIYVRYQSKEPNLCANAVNQIIQSYREYRAELFRDSKEYEFFNRQLEIAEAQLTVLEKRQSEFQQRESLLSPEQQNQILLNKLSVYEQELTEVKTERISREARIKIIHDQLKNDSTTIIPSTETSDSPSQKDYLLRLKGDLLNLEIERNRLLQVYHPEFEEVLKIEKQIRDARRKIKEEVELIIKQEQTAVNALLAREVVLKTAIDEIYSKMRDRSQQVFQFSELSRGVEDNREVYSMLLKQREEARISLAKMDNLIKIKVISPAVVPENPIKPKILLNIILSIILGTGLSLGIAFLAEYFDHTISSGEDVERYLDLPLLTSIPEQN
ncbi:hypothetical protein GF337_09140 [candidate division KSB1 bacterium]|nr:hypothetical protein [candidate division KSB1 bacterium]